MTRIINGHAEVNIYTKRMNTAMKDKKNKKTAWRVSAPEENSNY